MSISKNELLQALATTASGYFSGSPTAPANVPGVMKMLAKALLDATDNRLEVEDVQPAVPIEKSMTEDFMFCLECGRPMRSLKSHLRTRHHLTPADYRFKWGLPDSYPMMAPGASEVRSSISKEVQERIQADPTVNKGGWPKQR
ncbi:MAG: MucR family transcriptional regulator [Devosia sp.]|uniref:MucR family transcriptional regulator n=1 Tax=Devosia sp. TaxID=1871048 RepID=UPI0019D8CD9C|nr:MucR family transcriptional regulator [Devosia sp.]